MPRKIILLNKDHSSPLLEETETAEQELQEALKINPELLPVEELGVEGPLMVVGRETSVASGAVDLLGLGRGGEVVVIEFKTGPKNSDFRAAAAQLFDYGAQIWAQTYEDFESSVALRYFGSDRCPPHSPVRGAASLIAAAGATWIDMKDEDLDVFQRGLAQRLEEGSFHYVLAAQRFTPTMERTLQYLNSQLTAARFYGVELIRFEGPEIAVLEARTILRPEKSAGPGGGPRQTIDEHDFLERVEEAAYREALQGLFASCRSQGLRLAWGSSGVSVRFGLPTGKPVTVAWVFPPGLIGWMGLSDLTAGYAPSKPGTDKETAAFRAYLETLRNLPGATPVERVGLTGVHIDPRAASAAFPGVLDAILNLVRTIEEA